MQTTGNIQRQDGQVKREKSREGKEQHHITCQIWWRLHYVWARMAASGAGALLFVDDLMTDGLYFGLG